MAISHTSARPAANGFPELFKDLWRRTFQPWRNVAFSGGFLLTAVFGGWAIWIELVGMSINAEHHDVVSLQAAMVTFFPAIIGATFVQIVLDEGDDKRLLIFAFIVLLGALGAAVYLAFVPAAVVTTRIRGLAALCALALWFWGIANADVGTFKDEPEDAAIGGDPAASLEGDLGDLED